MASSPQSAAPLGASNEAQGGYTGYYAPIQDKGMEDPAVLAAINFDPSNPDATASGSGYEGQDNVEGQLFQRDLNGENIPRLVTGEMFFSPADMENIFDFQEPMYQQDKWTPAEPITMSYSGVDGIPGAELKQKSTTWSLAQRGAAAIQITDRQGYVRVFNQGLQGEFEGKKSFCSFKFQIASQLPAVTLRITRLNKKTVDVYFFADSVARNRTDGNPRIGIAFAGGPDAKVDPPSGHKETNWHNQSGNLFQVGIDLNAHGAKRMAKGIDPGRPKFHGISEKELADLYSKLPTDPKEAVSMDDADHLLALLSQTIRINIFRYWPQNVDGIQIANRVRDFMLTAFRMSVQVGNNWAYELQRSDGELELDHPDFPLASLQMPRFMGKRWKVKVDKDGMPIDDPKVVQCAAFCDEASKVYPDKKAMAFQTRMSVTREKDHQSDILRSSFAHDDFSIRAKFRKHERRPGMFVVELRTNDNSLLAKDPTLRPRVESRVRLDVLDRVDTDGDAQMGGATDGRPKKYNGLIAEDLWDSKAECVLIVEGPDLNLEQSDERRVKVECVDDLTPANRMLATIEQISMGLRDERTGTMPRKGVDIPNLVLRAPPEIEETGSMWEEINTSKLASEIAEVVKTIIDHFGLNEKQAEALKQAVATLTGRAIVKGPPGCGKTLLLAIMAYLMIEIGYHLDHRRCVLACAPSNVAADALLDKFRYILSMVPGAVEKFKPKGIRYRGSFTKEDKAERKKQASKKPADTKEAGKQEDTAMAIDGEEGEIDEEALKEQQQREHDEALLEALWDLAEDARPGHEHPNAEWGFYRQRLAAIERYAQIKDHSMSADAVEWLDLRRQLREPKNVPKDQLKEKKANFEDLELALTEYYLQNDVDIVFVTNSSSAAPTLRYNFKPRLLVSDEAAVTPLADCATPMGAYMDTLETIILGGDDQQQTPVVSSKGANEFTHLLSTSLFKHVWDGDSDDVKTELNVQHRMHPELCRPISEIFYAKKLTTADSVLERVNKQWLSLKQMLTAGFGAAWNGHRRIGVDVSDGTIRAASYNDTTSWYNAAEANAIVAFIKRATLETLSTAGDPIEPSSFLVLTHYTGQVQVIKSLLVKAGVNTARVMTVEDADAEMLDVDSSAKKDTTKTRVASTRAIQGEQAPFVILSMVRNDPKNPLALGVASDKHALNVAMSRPEEFLMVVGNWRPWVQSHLEGAKLLHNDNGGMRPFGKIVKDFHEQGDLIAYGDWLRFEGRKGIEKREWDSLFMDVGKQQGPSQRGGRGGSRGGGGHRGGSRGGGGFRGGGGSRAAAMEWDATGQAVLVMSEIVSAPKNSSSETKRKAQKANHQQRGGKKPPPPPPPPPGAAVA